MKGIYTALLIMGAGILSVLLTAPLGLEIVSGGLFLFGMLFLWAVALLSLLRRASKGPRR